MYIQGEINHKEAVGYSVFVAAITFTFTLEVMFLHLFYSPLSEHETLFFFVNRFGSCERCLFIAIKTAGMTQP